MIKKYGLDKIAIIVIFLFLIYHILKIVITMSSFLSFNLLDSISPSQPSNLSKQRIKDTLLLGTQSNIKKEEEDEEEKLCPLKPRDRTFAQIYHSSTNNTPQEDPFSLISQLPMTMKEE